MKLKRKPKIILISITLLVMLIVVGIGVYKIFNKPEVKEVKVLKTIDAYEYHLKDNKSKRYKELFKELEKILLEDKVSEEKYVQKIAEMFIYDFYSLSEKTTKTDIGGVDFVHPNALENFLKNAQDTYYKYVESNLYGERKQQLPTVSDITIASCTETEYVYGDTKAEKAYEVKVNWTYTEEAFSDYQSSTTLIFVKEGIKYYLVELQ